MSIESERSSVTRKRNELAKLREEYTREHAKIAPLQKKALDAESAIKRTKNQSTIKTKLSEIERANKGVMEATKKSDEIQKKINQKEKELNEAEKRLQKEQDRDEKKQQRASKKVLSDISCTIKAQSLRQDQLSNELENLMKLPQEITILFLASNPSGTGKLQLDEEARSIQNKIRLSEYRDTIKFETRWAVRTADIFQSINETNPTIIHFSGHGCNTGDLILENPDGSPKKVTPEAISQAIATVSDSVRLVVFNACYSQTQAERIVDFIDSSIGMSTSIGDEAACVFSAQFYSSIGFGRSLETAFRQAKAELMLEGIPEDQTPVLFCKDGLSANDIVYVE